MIIQIKKKKKKTKSNIRVIIIITTTIIIIKHNNHHHHHPIRRPDMTFAVDWALSNNYLSIYHPILIISVRMNCNNNNDILSSTYPVIHCPERCYNDPLCP